MPLVPAHNHGRSRRPIGDLCSLYHLYHSTAFWITGRTVGHGNDIEGLDRYHYGAMLNFRYLIPRLRFPYCRVVKSPKRRRIKHVSGLTPPALRIGLELCAVPPVDRQYSAFCASEVQHSRNVHPALVLEHLLDLVR